MEKVELEERLQGSKKQHTNNLGDIRECREKKLKSSEGSAQSGRTRFDHEQKQKGI